MNHRTRTALATAAAAVLTGGLLTVATATTAVAADSATVLRPDFNCDGKGDVVTGAMLAHVGGKAEAGQIVALYGSSTGISATKRTVISQDTAGVPGAAEAGDRFGLDTAFGDFDKDGCDDLAVGAPGEDVSGDVDAGSVTILWGSASGLTGSGSITVKDPASSSHDQWGNTLAIGDFDRDGQADLAATTTKTKLYVYRGGITRAGATGGWYGVVTPLYTGQPDPQEDIPPINIHAGDVTGDGATDLVVDGMEFDEYDGYPHNYLFLGGKSGLQAESYQELRPGVVTAIGDIDRDGFGDIVSGAEWNESDGYGATPYGARGGQVWITYGTGTGVDEITAINQDTSGVPGASETDDRFGFELDLGDVNKDGYLDLAVGVPGEDVDGYEDAGSIVVLYGSAAGITGAGSQSFHQDTAGFPGGNEDNDNLGMDVKLDDVTGDGRADLVAGSWENDNGSVVYLPVNTTTGKITTTGSRSLSPTAVGVSTSGYPGFGVNFAD
ncbi:FG-GAP-like repeat-containing protein [Streptomyces sp. UH6]|uniref:FG-GAP-like repeat-containing protein n=1 Tax=Streptomyces sp. UH6 TaxID=2748379 RepID=UPI0015D49F0F|nr:FG-GAP-like repeat-containing protein [Streptomyces sp. UH6]NYV78514.1 VCBS repeat-containing protein [Streptomyces sp. UH6]